MSTSVNRENIESENMAKAKNKGSSEERAIVNWLRSHDISCQRTLESGARSDGSDTWDIDIHLDAADPNTATLIGECKCQEKIGDYLWSWLGENSFLSLRKNRRERLFVIKEDVFLEYLKLKQKEMNHV